MKIKLFFIGILFFALSTLDAQTLPSQQKELVNDLPLYNLFYLSKYLDDQNLNDDQSTAVKAQFFNLIGSDNLKILSDNKDHKFDNLNFYLTNLIHNSPKNVQFITYLKTEKWDEFQKLFFKNESYLKSSDLLKEIQNLTQQRNADKNTQEQYSIDIAKFKNEIEAKNRKIDTLKSYKSENVTSDISLEQEAIKKDLIAVESLSTSNQKLTPKIKENDDLLMDKITAYADKYFKDNPKVLKTPYTKQDVLKFYIEKEKLQEVNISTNYVQSVQSQGSSTLSVPSQSQLIDAMAIFLANRAKQEAAIWFMDQLRSRLKNPLVKDAFPETIQLLQRLEDYKVPNFGIEWRYAISSDFIKMPVHISESAWIKEMVSDQKEAKELIPLIKFGYEVNRLMAQNYNYRDLIQKLYLDRLQSNSSLVIDEYLNKNVSLLYVLTNELYSIDNSSSTPTFRLLTYEELNSLDTTQWNFLIEMVHLKYFSDPNNKNSGELAAIMQEIKIKKQESNIFASKILLNLSQFDKIRNELQDSKSREKADFSKQNLFTAWKIIDQVLDNLGDIKNVLTLETKTIDLIDKNVKNLKTSFSIYDDIQKRNFTSAIQKTLTLGNQYYAYKKIADKGENSILVNDKKPKFTFTKNGDSINIYKVVLSKNDKTNKCIFQLKFDAEAQRKLKIYNLDYPDKKFLDNVTNSVKKYENFLKELKITSFEFVKYINPDIQISPLNSIPKKSLDNKIYDYQNNLNEKYGAHLLKLTSFFGDVLTTTNSQQLSDVIGSHALPPTSYKLKRKVKSSIDLNAYVGAYGGYTFPSANSTFDKNWTGGITAPIGITFSKSLGDNKSPNIGVSFNFIDLGNIVNHYLTSTEKYYKDVHFSEVFSPNINFLYSIPRTPAVVFIGATFLPLKNVTVSTEIKNNRAFDVMIIQAGLAIDIPLINLWTNEKN